MADPLMPALCIKDTSVVANRQQCKLGTDRRCKGSPEGSQVLPVRATGIYGGKNSPSRSQETLSSVFCTAVRGAVPWPASADLWPVLQQDIQVVVGERRQLREVASTENNEATSADVQPSTSTFNPADHDPTWGDDTDLIQAAKSMETTAGL
ncbi:uncharacterized protein LOC144867859 isoform X1 [Branchiostoma floridae x Branchiostoma japonicum]